MFEFLLESTGSTSSPGTPWLTIGMLAVLGVMMFFMFRNSKKQEKQVSEMRENLQVGDEITTIGGIIGKIVSIKDETILVETGRDKVKIRFLRSAVRSVDVKAEDAE